jgi:hypothetical protein
MTENVGIMISIISAVIATLSAIFSWRAVVTAEKTYSAELISQLYTTYQSEELLDDLQIVWGIYHKIWEQDSTSKESADIKTNGGLPIKQDKAEKLVEELASASAEYRAIHNTIYFWTYLSFLLYRKALTVAEITAFTSPRILGLLYPIEIAIAARRSTKLNPQYSLKRAYDIIKATKQF